jgi:hypothetical protein
MSAEPETKKHVLRKPQPRLNLVQHPMEKEREAKETRILVENYHRAGLKSGNPLFKAYNMPTDPKIMMKLTKTLKRQMDKKLASTREATRKAAVKTLGGSVADWDNNEQEVHEALTAELAAVEAELAMCETSFNKSMTLKGNKVHKPLSPKGAHCAIKEGSQVWGSGFKWDKTQDTCYMQDLSWPVANISTKMKFMGGRYGEITRQLDLPGGNPHLTALGNFKPSKMLKQKRDMDRKSTTGAFLRATYNMKYGPKK